MQAYDHADNAYDQASEAGWENRELESRIDELERENKYRR